jgi:carbamoyl-phosphate synthase small subunit
MRISRPALLALEDGTLWPGRGFGVIGDTFGEIVFNTSLTGYQEILTDPSYHGQIVTMTMPHIGNYGVTPEDDESDRVWAAGLVVRSLSPLVSSWRARQSLPDYLLQKGVVAITDVDTRALTRHIRTHGAMRAALSTSDPDPERLLAMARNGRDMNGLDLAREVTCAAPYEWTEGTGWWRPDMVGADPVVQNDPDYHVVAYDFGIKRNILRQLASRQLLGQKPIFGICLGHQILALALGASTYKLKFGHRGGNQPVQVADSGAVQISSHNHGFAVDAATLPPQVSISHVNLNDSCCEGLAAPDHLAFSIQYHPESAPGPHDSDELFDRFIEMMRET